MAGPTRRPEALFGRCSPTPEHRGCRRGGDGPVKDAHPDLVLMDPHLPAIARDERQRGHAQVGGRRTGDPRSTHDARGRSGAALQRPGRCGRLLGRGADRTDIERALVAVSNGEASLAPGGATAPRPCGGMHHYAQREAVKAGIGFEALDNGFAS